MAQLAQPQSSGFNVDELPPAGTFVAVILDVQDLFGVQRPKFENPGEKETIDVTRILFGFQGQDGRLYKIQTREMRISGNPKAKLFQFLTSLLGHQPKYGWDYCEIIGRAAMITVMHQQGQKDPTKTYANIATAAPLPHQLQNAVPPVAAFNYTREGQAVGAQGPKPQQPQPTHPAHAPQAGYAPQQHPQPHQASYPQNGYAQQQMPQQPPPAPYQYPMHLPQGPGGLNGQHAPVAPQQAPAPQPYQPQVPQPQQPQAPAQAYPQQVQTPAPAPASPVPAPASVVAPAPAPAPQQEAPTGLWNPETDDPGEIPF